MKSIQVVPKSPDSEFSDVARRDGVIVGRGVDVTVSVSELVVIIGVMVLVAVEVDDSEGSIVA